LTSSLQRRHTSIQTAICKCDNVNHTFTQFFVRIWIHFAEPLKVFHKTRPIKAELLPEVNQVIDCFLAASKKLVKLLLSRRSLSWIVVAVCPISISSISDKLHATSPVPILVKY